ncbi:hypothetical protein CBM2615_A120163 [Cupriavidus taiwanensis]|uniref:Uncharacterized protein n=1 Tax=Cupriavidus taiwanensis TaxID=164546 RepID=A0A976ATA1_9BURK|nr:hypothetical protein [Cupriavidus taiwanensis]SOZ49342.1 hypothetical protein CBM2615_A120163 [Cupriavidus taiwanensis]SOZ49413.1 hypothetical protein CBM2614_A120160 [Cupriavidus taiwanensis]SOZ52007.1 hypothetical protein CBM2613_A110162 [Cupriavidus taiwanensis]SPA07171.1 hypothetical protein CBM2625_A90160 [Cupriavidus taiwanensis]
MRKSKPPVCILESGFPDGHFRPEVVDELIDQFRWRIVRELCEGFIAAIPDRQKAQEWVNDFEHYAESIIGDAFATMNAELRAGIEVRSRRTTQNGNAFTDEDKRLMRQHFNHYCLERQRIGQKVVLTGAYRYVAAKMGRDTTSGIKNYLKNLPIPELPALAKRQA